MRSEPGTISGAVESDDIVMLSAIDVLRCSSWNVLDD